MESAFRTVDALKQMVRQFQLQIGRAYRQLGVPFGVLLILTFCAHLAFGQSYQTSTGSPSFAAPEPVELGFVDASNGNLHLSIPLGSYSQRGASQPQAITFEYDSSLWTPQVEGGTLAWEISDQQPGWVLGGWYYSTQVSGVNDVSSLAQQCYTDITWTDQNGTAHLFHLNENTDNEAGCPSTADAFASDSSGYHMYVTGAPAHEIGAPGYAPDGVYAPDGTLVAPWVSDPQGRPVISEDSNGNYMSLLNSMPETVYDTLNRPIFSGCSVCGLTPTVSTSQGTAQYSLSTATINVKTDFQQSSGGVPVQETSTTLTVISSLKLPDAAGSTYSFTYDCDESTGPECGSPSGQSAYYGELIGITLPTGGKVSYSYTVFGDAYGNKSEWVHSRSAASGSWSYTPQVLNSCSANQYWPANSCEQKTTVSSPTGQTIYTFQLNNGAWPATVVREDLQGNVQSTVTNTWDFSQPCVPISCNGASYVRLLGQQTTVPSTVGNLTKQTKYTYDNPQQGNQTTIKEWGYYLSGSFPSVPDRATYISYLSTGTNNINRPQSVTLCNNSGSDPTNCPGGGSRVSQTVYTYDCYSGSGCTALAAVNGVAQHDDTNFGTGNTARGNPTSVSHWVSGSTYLTTSYAYDTTGQVVSEKDPAGNVTQYFYTDNFYTDPGNGQPPSSYSAQSPTNAYVTSVTDAIGTQTMGYYWGSGKTAIATDYNLVSTTSHYQDGLDRQTEEIDPIGWSMATYSSAAQSDMYTAVADTSPSIACVSCQHTQTNLDSWGRTASQILVNNPIGSVEVDSSYDTDERLQTQSHPFSGSGDPNHVSETVSYDALDRQISITHPDGQAQQVAYGPNIGNLQGVTSQQGSTTTYGYGYPQVSEDESGNERQQWSDGFGRVIEIDEPSSSGALTSSPLVTNYLFDAGDHLIEVIQGVQTRIFAYDGLGRKISENTPEGGTVTYAYTASGGGLCSGDPSKVCQRTDARNVVSTYTYDHANRLTGVAYTIPSGLSIAAMPSVCTTVPNGTSANICNYYDQGGKAAYAIGRLTEMVDATGSESYSHDANGRATQLSKVINSQTYSIGYQYDAGGDVTQITYPSGRIVQQAYNQVGQLCQIAPSATNCSAVTSYYAANFSYNAPGKLLGFSYGNGVKATFYYSPDRTQLVYLAYTQGNSTYFNLQYSYCQNSSYAPSCANGTFGNNGSVQCITDNVDSGRSVGYGYDPLQRMTSAKTCGSPAFSQWGLTESYDRFGNRWSQTMTAGTGPQGTLSFGNNGMNSSTTNQPNGYTYDASGNMTVEPLLPSNFMTYDGENRMTAFSGSGGAASYAYDGNGLRVVKSVSGGTMTVSIFSGSSVIAEYDNGAAPALPSREYIYNGSGDTTGLLAMFSGGATTYYHQDHLSVRLTTDGTSGSPTYGQVLSQEGHFPFGEQWYESGAANEWFFTSYQQDSESGLNYALARYYNSRTGTFCSADPLAGSPGDPQSWNRYPYGRNNPITITDPSGKSWWGDLGAVALSIAGMVTLDPELTSEALALGFASGMDDTGNALFNGQVPPKFGLGGSMALGASWNGTPIMPSGGLTSGIQGALGLPTMADAVNPAMNQTDTPNYSQTPSNYEPWQMRLPVLNYLKSDKDCLHWLNSGGGDAYKLMSTVPILLDPKSETPGWTQGSLGDPQPIYVGAWGPFYASSIPPGVAGSSAKPGTQRIRMTILLHELAHQLGIHGFVDDGRWDTGPAQSEANTKLLLKHCL
jgi:RHS repeat-associated protein